jgi:hypothetical protein
LGLTDGGMVRNYCPVGSRRFRWRLLAIAAGSR